MSPGRFLIIRPSDEAKIPKIAKLNQIENDKNIYSNYDIETCMIDKATTYDTELDDTHFKDYFAKNIIILVRNTVATFQGSFNSNMWSHWLRQSPLQNLH